MTKNYTSFIKELAFKYFKENQMKEFMFKTKSIQAGMIEFEDEADVT